MILETQNTKENDIIIYSRNSMDDSYNYRIIFVNDPESHHRVISYDQVKKLVLEHFQKNLIAYRLVSNYPDVTLGDTKHGFTIFLNEEPELIFTDPVFAVQAMEGYLELNSGSDFRFRVQKVGYSALGPLKGKTNFKEEFCFDMNVEDVINQSDEKIVDVLLAKRGRYKKKKKFRSEEKRSRVFAPEQESGEKYFPPSTPVENHNHKFDVKKLAIRQPRQVEGKMMYGNTYLNLGTLELVRDEKKQLEFDFVRDRMVQIKDYQTIKNSRENQSPIRSTGRIEERVPEKNDAELESKYAGKSINQQVEFIKIHRSEPIKIKKIGLKGEDEEATDDEKHESVVKDELFNGFVNSLRNESTAKHKKQRKRKDTDLLFLFKTLQKKEDSSDEGY